MKAVANSSVLIALSSFGQLGLLHQRFPAGLLIPRAVWHEVVETGQGHAGAQEVAHASWISVGTAQDQDLVGMLRMELDSGEAEAIVLCREQQADTVLLDEKDARRVAQRMGLAVLGSVGILMWAKRAGYIESLSVQLDILRDRGRFHLSPAVYEEALREVGETSPKDESKEE